MPVNSKKNIKIDAVMTGSGFIFNQTDILTIEFCKGIRVDPIAEVYVPAVIIKLYVKWQMSVSENINIMMISTSEIKVSCVIEEKYTELAVRVLHEVFGLDEGADKN